MGVVAAVLWQVPWTGSVTAVPLLALNGAAARPGLDGRMWRARASKRSMAVNEGIGRALIAEGCGATVPVRGSVLLGFQGRFLVFSF